MNLSACIAKVQTYIFSATRQREPGEIIPTSAQYAVAYQNDEGSFGAHRSIDLDLHTRSFTDDDAYNESWLMIKLDSIHCVERVIRYKTDGTVYTVWTCSNTACGTCDGAYCSSFSLTVYSADTTGLTPSPVCRYGDTVKLQFLPGGAFQTKELSIIRSEGEMKKRQV